MENQFAPQNFFWGFSPRASARPKTFRLIFSVIGGGEGGEGEAVGGASGAERAGAARLDEEPGDEVAHLIGGGAEIDREHDDDVEKGVEPDAGAGGGVRRVRRRARDGRRAGAARRPRARPDLMPFQKLIHLTPGFHRVRVPIGEISGMIDVREPFGIELIPNDEIRETTLYFGLMEFVTELAESKLPEGTKAGQTDKKIKCVVWDLDNTMWDGVLVEDGAEKLRLKPGVAEVIQAFDQRGILHSIASKNNSEDALEVVKRFHLEQYFLCPQISWKPKSEAMKAIAQQLNIGMDSILFVDDSEFELGEVKAVSPEVRVLNAEHYLSLLERNECQVPVTAESRERRKLYQVEAKRQSLAESFSNDYMAFLRHCQIRLTVRAMTEENLERVHELTQRTNQMNFSGNRYDREVLRKLLASPHLGYVCPEL